VCAASAASCAACGAAIVATEAAAGAGGIQMRQATSQTNLAVFVAVIVAGLAVVLVGVLLNH
jgi:hypothetical protein